MPAPAAGPTPAPPGYRSRCKLEGEATTNPDMSVPKVFGLRFYGFIAWLLWRGLYLLKIPTLARKARFFFEWSWGMFFPHDIVHLRFTRTPRGAKFGYRNSLP
jgi:NADH dehydrogenase